MQDLLNEIATSGLKVGPSWYIVQVGQNLELQNFFNSTVQASNTSIVPGVPNPSASSTFLGAPGQGQGIGGNPNSLISTQVTNNMTTVNATIPQIPIPTVATIPEVSMYTFVSGKNVTL